MLANDPSIADWCIAVESLTLAPPETLLVLRVLESVEVVFWE